MHITEVRIQLLPAGSGERPDDKLRAFARITVADALVVRDIKVIEGEHGLFVAMPSRRRSERCGPCGAKNPLGARYCAHCGARRTGGAIAEEGSRRYADVCHPVNQAARAALEAIVVAAYRAEAERAACPGYVASPLDECAPEPEVEPGATAPAGRAR